MRGRVLCCALPLLVGLAAPLHQSLPQGPAPKSPEDPAKKGSAGLEDSLKVPDAYPPVRPKALVHYFTIEGDLKADPIKRALVELGTPEIEARIVYGPENTVSFPRRFFVAIEAPAAVGVRELMNALRKGASKIEEAEWTCFQGKELQVPDPDMGAKYGVGMRDWIVGSSNELRWTDTVLGFHQFYYAPGKMTAAEIADKWKKLFGPFGSGEVGVVVREGFTWRLADPIDTSSAKKAEKAIGKLDGVKESHIDVAAKRLVVAFDLDGLKISGPIPAKPAGLGAGAGEVKTANAESQPAPRPHFDTTPVFDILDKEKITLAPPEPGSDGKDEPVEKRDGGGH